MRAKYWLVGAAMTATTGGAAQAQVVDTMLLAAVAAPVASVGVAAGTQVETAEPPTADAAVLSTPDAPFGAAVVASEDLGDMSGGQAVLVAISNHDLDAVNRNNTINADTVGSGNVSLGESAFSGFNGIGNFVINTGHNNNLQGSLSVNVVLAQ